MRTNSSVARAKKPKMFASLSGFLLFTTLMPLASWFGPFRHFVLAHPWDVKGLGNIHPVVVAAVGMWESLLSDFQGLWEGWETVSSFSHAFHGPWFPPPLSG